MQNILITGATGLLGKHLTAFFIQHGYKVFALTRKPANQINSDSLIWIGSLVELNDTHIDIVINLAGSSIHDRYWDESAQNEALESRIGILNKIYSWYSNLIHKPNRVIIASSIGYYGICPFQQWEMYLTEDHFAQPIFYSNLHRSYETKAIELFGHRATILRLGHVFTKHGGTLSKMLRPIKMRLFGKIEGGKSPIPWVHIDDVCRSIIFLIDNHHCKGPFNVVAPHPLSQGEFSEISCSHFNRKPIFKSIPRWMFHIALGEQADLFIDGSYCYPGNLLNCGFEFNYTYFEDALQNLHPNQ